MAYNPLSREQQERRRKMFDRSLPFVLVFLLFALIGLAAYKSAYPKPTKPEQWAYQGRLGKVADPPFMPQCNDGQFVTDLRECREYHQKLIYAINRPRKHKRKPDEFFAYAGHGGWHIDADPRYQVYEEFRFINTLPMELSCTKRTNTSGMHCESRPLTPAEIDQYKPMAEKPAAPSDNIFTIQGGGTVLCPETGCMTTAEKAAEYDQLALDHGQDFYDNVFVPGGECTDRERYRELQCQMGGKCLIRNLDSKNWCPVVEWHIDPPAKPDCKMPADIDVCPAQQLDPKKSHD